VETGKAKENKTGQTEVCPARPPQIAGTQTRRQETRGFLSQSLYSEVPRPGFRFHESAQIMPF
jgi:hypothetical protein